MSMFAISPSTVDAALLSGITVLMHAGRATSSRNGPVYSAPGLVATLWDPAVPRVSYSRTRDANPFLHLLEFAWMITGSKDATFMKWLLPAFAQYSDDGVTLPATYGHRWRGHFGLDQLPAICEHLVAVPNTRRATLTMADPLADLGNLFSGKDLPCNLTATFTPRADNVLDLTVMCRSNDIMMGAYGANVVQFSFLHALVAQQAMMYPGTYTQLSADYHVYAKDLIEKGFVPTNTAETPEQWKTVHSKTFADEIEATFTDIDKFKIAQTTGPLFASKLESTTTAMNALVELVLNKSPSLRAPENVGPFEHTAYVFAAALSAHRAKQPLPDSFYSDYGGGGLLMADWVLAAELWLRRRNSSVHLPGLIRLAA